MKMFTFTFYFFLLLTEVYSEFLRMKMQTLDDGGIEQRNFKMRNRMDFVSHGRYSTTIGFGNPPQHIKVVIDPSSPDFWVTSATCPRGSDYCDERNSYNSSKSITYVADGRPYNFTYEYNSGSGIRSIDNVYVAGIELENQHFGEITKLETDTKYEHFYGVMGLAIDTSDNESYFTPFYSMYKRGFIEELKYSIYINDDGGEIIFGASDPNYYVGDFNYVSLESGIQWLFKMNDVQVNKKSLCPNSCLGFIFSTMRGILPPKRRYKKIIRAIGKYKRENGMIWVPCSDVQNLPLLNFTINELEYVFHPKDYIIREPTNENKCFIAIWENKFDYLKEYWVFGGIFMKKFYLEFDVAHAKLGIARAITP